MSNNPRVDTLLREGNWSAAINTYGISVAQQGTAAGQLVQLAGGRSLDPKRFKVFIRPNADDYDTPSFFLVNPDREGAIQVELWMNGLEPNINLYTHRHNPEFCDHMLECHCDDTEDEECLYCTEGSDWCAYHGEYH